MRICKIISVLLNADNMEEVNDLTGVADFNTDNWCDKSDFKRIPKLYEYLDSYEKEILNNNQVDYVVFRLEY